MPDEQKFFNEDDWERLNPDLAAECDKLASDPAGFDVAAADAMAEQSDARAQQSTLDRLKEARDSFELEYGVLQRMSERSAVSESLTGNDTGEQWREASKQSGIKRHAIANIGEKYRAYAKQLIDASSETLPRLPLFEADPLEHLMLMREWYSAAVEVMSK